MSLSVSILSTSVHIHELIIPVPGVTLTRITSYNVCYTKLLRLGLPLTKAFLIVLELASVIALWLIYWQFSIVREIPYVIPYFVLALTIPYLILIWIIYTATSAKHFHRASTVNKIVMFMGILLTLLAGQVF